MAGFPAGSGSRASLRIFSQAGRFSRCMEPESGPGKQYGEGYKYVSYGLTFAGGIILFMLVGFWIDRLLGVVPLFTIVGTLLGGVLSFLRVYWRLEAERTGNRQTKDDSR